MKKISLLNTFCAVINNSSIHSLDYTLANYFLRHLSTLSELNIYDVAAECFCTRQSIRRFCLKIGFSNFSAMKRYYDLYERQKAEYVNRLQVKDCRSNFKKSMEAMLLDMDASFDSEAMMNLAQVMHESRQITLVMDSGLLSLATFFQRAMIFCGKIIHLVTNDFSGNSLLTNMYAFDAKRQNEWLDQQESEDMVLTISMTGNFAFASLDIIQACRAKKILATLNHQSAFEEVYDRVCYLSKQNHGNEGVTAFTIHGVNYFLDSLFASYYECFGEGNLDE